MQTTYLRLVRLAAASLVLALPGCASFGGPLEEPLAAPSTESPHPEERALPAPAAQYGTAVGRRMQPLDVDAARVEASATRFLATRGDSLVPDARLDGLAAWADCRRGHFDQLTADGVKMAARRLGIVEPIVDIFCLEASPEASLDDVFASMLGNVPSNVPITHIGVSMRSVMGGFVGAIALSSRRVDVDPFARRMAAGGTFDLVGRLPAGFESARLSVTTPSGSTVERSGPASFSFPLRFRDRGEYQVEVFGDGPTGPVVVLNVPVYVGVEDKSRIRERALPARFRHDADVARAELLTALNAERARNALDLVLPDDELAAVALAHSKDMLERDFFSHVSPTTGSPEARVRAAKVAVADFGENIALAQSAAQAHAGLLESPGHRAAMLTKAFTHVGIGVVQRADGWLFVTQVFGRRPPPIVVADAPATLLARMNAQRGEAGLRPLKTHAALSAATAAAAQAASIESDPEPFGRAATLRARPKTLRDRTMCAWSLRVVDLDAGLPASLASDTGAEYAAIGVASLPASAGQSTPQALVVVSAASYKGARVACGPEKPAVPLSTKDELMP